jgi:hypothetical protein
VYYWFYAELLHHAARREGVCEALFSSVGVSICRCVDLSICTVLPLNTHTTKTCLLHVLSVK